MVVSNPNASNLRAKIEQARAASPSGTLGGSATGTSGVKGSYQATGGGTSQIVVEEGKARTSEYSKESGLVYNRTESTAPQFNKTTEAVPTSPFQTFSQKAQAKLGIQETQKGFSIGNRYSYTYDQGQTLIETGKPTAQFYPEYIPQMEAARRIQQPPKEQMQVFQLSQSTMSAAQPFYGKQITKESESIRKEKVSGGFEYLAKLERYGTAKMSESSRTSLLGAGLVFTGTAGSLIYGVTPVGIGESLIKKGLDQTAYDYTVGSVINFFKMPKQIMEQPTTIGKLAKASGLVAGFYIGGKTIKKVYTEPIGALKQYGFKKSSESWQQSLPKSYYSPELQLNKIRTESGKTVGVEIGLKTGQQRFDNIFTSPQIKILKTESGRLIEQRGTFPVKQTKQLGLNEIGNINPKQFKVEQFKPQMNIKSIPNKQVDLKTFGFKDINAPIKKSPLYKTLSKPLPEFIKKQKETFSYSNNKRNVYITKQAKTKPSTIHKYDYAETESNIFNPFTRKQKYQMFEETSFMQPITMQGARTQREQRISNRFITSSKSERSLSFAPISISSSMSTSKNIFTADSITFRQEVIPKQIPIESSIPIQKQTPISFMDSLLISSSVSKYKPKPPKAPERPKPNDFLMMPGSNNYPKKRKKKNVYNKRQIQKYNPSLIAVSERLFGKPSKKLTGLEIRPISLKNIRW